MSGRPADRARQSWRWTVWLIAGGLFAACIEKGAPVIRDAPAAERIQTLFDVTRVSLTTSQAGPVLERLAAGYRHQGRDRQALAAFLADLFGLSGDTATFENLVVDIGEGQATASFVLRLERCAEVAEGEPCTLLYRCSSANQSACGWFNQLVEVDHRWLFAGDGSRWGTDVYLRAGAAGLELAGGLRDPSSSLAGATITWRGTTTTISLERLSSDYWRIPAGTFVPAEIYPGHPLPWTVEAQLLLGEGGTQTIARELAAVPEAFAGALSPDGESEAPLEFRWNAPLTPPLAYRVEVWLQEFLVWRSPATFATALAYNGPTLTPGERYTYRVLAHDAYGNVAEAGASLVLLDPANLPPAPLSITPSVGTASTSQEIVLLGSDFLPGARVLIGIEECLVTATVEDELTCVAPPLAAGTYTVLVVNPAPRVGMLERAYRVLGP